jgi:hypothetical protein
MLEPLKEDLAEIEKAVKEMPKSGPIFAALGDALLTIRDAFLDEAAECRDRNANEAAQAWEQAAKFVGEFGNALVPPVALDERG